MKLNDKYVTDYRIDFDNENTFISGSGDTLMQIAPAELVKLDAESKTILVTDPWLFPIYKANKIQEETAYENDLVSLFKGTKAKKIIFCAKEKKNVSLFGRVQQQLKNNGIDMDFDDRLEECHDRFWYCPETEKCVIFGTSMNGIGKKICRIDELKPTEVMELKNYFIAANILANNT